AYKALFDHNGRNGDRVTRWRGGANVWESSQVACHMFDLGDIVIHSRCVKLVEALQVQQWEKQKGAPTNRQAQKHPHTDLCDALRGATLVAYPEGIILPPSNLTQIKARGFF